MESPAPSVGSSSLCPSTWIWCPLAPANGPARYLHSKRHRKAPQGAMHLRLRLDRGWNRLRWKWSSLIPLTFRIWWNSLSSRSPRTRHTQWFTLVGPENKFKNMQVIHFSCQDLVHPYHVIQNVGHVEELLQRCNTQLQCYGRHIYMTCRAETFGVPEVTHWISERSYLGPFGGVFFLGGGGVYISFRFIRLEVVAAEQIHGKIRDLAPIPREHVIFQSIHGLCARKNSTVY